MSELQVPQSAIPLFPCTFDAEKYSPGPKPQDLLERYRLDQEQPVILTVARLAGEERYKGYDTVLQALPAIREIFPNVRYLLGGSGPDRPRVEVLSPSWA